MYKNGIASSLIKKQLTQKENDYYMKLFKESNNEDYKNILIIGNVKLVLSIVHHYSSRHDDLEDLFQVGIIGLIKAIDNFDLSYHLKLSTYAVPLIKGEIKKYLRDNTGVKMSRSLKDLSLLIIRTIDEYIEQYSLSPTSMQIAEILNLSIEDVEEGIMCYSHAKTKSLDQPIDENNDIRIIDSLSNEKNSNYIQSLDLKNALEKLSVREQEMIYKRYYVGLTQSEISSELMISQAQVSRKEKEILNKLHKLMK